MVDNLPRKTTYSKSCHAFTPNMRDVPIHVRYKNYCMIFTHLHACMYHFHKTACYSTRKINHATEISFQMSNLGNSMHCQHCFTLHVIQQKMRHANWVFFPVSLPENISMHCYHFSYKKHVINQEYNTCKLEIFPDFQLRKQYALPTLLSHQKLHVIQ